MSAADPISKGLISGRAPGYWGGGGGIKCRIDQEAIADKVIALNYEKIIAMGLPVSLWLESQRILTVAHQCTCFKDTAKQPDVPCAQCYGTGFTPGYFKFGTQNFWVDAPLTYPNGTDSGGTGQDAWTSTGTWTLTNVVLDTTNRPYRLMLDPASTTGTAISPNITISPATLLKKKGVWEARADAFTRDGGANSTITVEASKDNGTTWFALTALEAQAPTTLRFRVTFTRTAVTVKTPMFEIVRARFPVMLDIRGELNEPVILVIPTWLTEAELRQTHGLKLETQGGKFWTMPLTYFYEAFTVDTKAARIADDVFMEHRFGTDFGFRYPIIQFSYSETFSRFTRQEFETRKAAGDPGSPNGEVYFRVF